MLKMLANLLKGNKQQQIRDIIHKFKINQKIVNVQRNFLKRLLQSKAGMVLLAFREIKGLP